MKTNCIAWYTASTDKRTISGKIFFSPYLSHGFLNCFLKHGKNVELTFPGYKTIILLPQAEAEFKFDQYKEDTNKGLD
jgi:hypothetical protein